MLANRRPTGEFDQQSMPVPCVEQGRNAAALLDREVDGLGAGDDGLDDVGSEEGQWQEAADLIAVQIGMGHAAPKFLRKAIKRNGQPNVFVTYRLPAYRAVLKNVEMAKRQETSRWLNNRVENSHQPLRRRERAMQRVRQNAKFAELRRVHSSVHNHFNQERYLQSRENFKVNRAAALAEWRQFGAAQDLQIEGSLRPDLVRLTMPLQYHMKGRRTEIDVINGLVVDESRRLGLPTPVSDVLIEINQRVSVY